MEKIELLSPVGEVKNFYTAIRSGANAVYLGLPKFNARMRAENISLDNLSSLVSFAHLKNVKVYVVINILLTSNEFKDMCSMVGECINAKVDAFIVQDYGVIGVLKEMYPDIVLHGSTQLGVHNIRGAKVAKSMGLSRVVLSREVTMKDIEEIARNVDIELEVFIQGAMCVGFSGNCYISSIKCGASGNRGECKQLCRLPYNLSDGKKSLSGYMISPRDNCMLPYLDKLISIGVKSLKIEGRLRNDNYISIATTTYRNAIDEIYELGVVEDIDNKVLALREVFSRGDYISGYFDGNNIINIRENNHLGKKIGKVLSCSKFKDIYKITINSSEPLKCGDGIKFVYNNEVISMGVGNVDINGRNYIIYGNKYIHNDSIVYLSKSQDIGSIDNSYYRSLDISFVGLVGNRCRLTLCCGNEKVEVTGDVVEVGQKKVTDIDTIKSQLSKIDKDIFTINNIDVIIDNGYIPLSVINNLRRNATQLLTSNLLSGNAITKEKELSEIEKPVLSSRYNKVAIVDERFDFSEKFESLILSPSVYSLNVIDDFKKRFKNHYSNNLVINLPIIARVEDLKIIDEIVENNLDCEFVANNIYALDYLKIGAKVWAGSGLNITNDYTCKYLIQMGVIECISSIEKWAPTISGSYKITSGQMTLMTFAHCPFKTLHGNDCANCMYSSNVILSSNDKYKIRRVRTGNCYFELIDNINVSYKYGNEIIDLRK